jgi:EAL and modified HD-GYP domain-containing signal transduction protein
MDVFVARQPIFDRDEQLAGYELLYRNTATSTVAAGAAAETMCTDTVIHAFLDIGLHELTDGVRAFINCTRDFLLNQQVDLLPPDKVVVELLETVGFDEPVIQACQRLRSKGYVLALDDYVDDTTADPMLRLAGMVKLDVLDASSEELAALVARLRPFGVTLLAERVETREVHERCMALGFDLFQGYYYSRPEIVARKEIEVGTAGMIRLLNLLLDPDATDSDVEQGFRADPALTYKLLRIVNSAAVGGRGVESIPFAIRMVGRQMLYRWLALLMVSSMVTGNGVNDQLVYATLVRARLCELIAESSPTLRTPQALFMTGIFSRLDVLLRLPMADVLSRVSVADDIQLAVLHDDGSYAVPLRLAAAYESGQWERVDELAPELGLLPVQMPWLYTKALAWVNQQLDLAHETDEAA